MRKTTIGAMATVLVAFGLLVTGIAVAGGNGDRLGIYSAPFSKVSGAMSAKGSRCRSNPQLPTPDLGRPDPKTGRIGLVESVNGISCDGGATMATTWSFELGRTPAPLVGKPGIVRVVIRRNSKMVGTDERGTSERSATTGLSMKGAPRVTLISINCVAASCDRYEIPVRGNLIVAEFAIPSMPSTMDLDMDVSARMGAGTGGAAAWFAGTIIGVSVTAG